MVAYVHIEYSTYQFSAESKGVLTVPKKPGPERVNAHAKCSEFLFSISTKNS